MTNIYKNFPDYQVLKTQIFGKLKELKVLQDSLEAFEDDPENNRFESEDDALDALEEKFLERATKACEGAYNCGPDTYTQGCFIGGVEYVFRMDIEYNRHDKTYYYPDEWATDLSPKE